MPDVPSQGEIYYCEFPEPIRSRPVLVLSRSDINATRDNIVVALVTRTVRNVPLEVAVGDAEGLPKECVVSLGDVHTVRRDRFSRKLGQISKTKLHQVFRALSLLFALPNPE